MDVKIFEETCCSCGILFWIGEEYQKRLVATKQNFYCPNGHSMSYVGESDKAKAIRLEKEKQQILRDSNTKIEAMRIECAKKKRKVYAKKSPKKK